MRRLEQFVSGKAIVVTGGGGSIGSEICERMLIFGAARLLVLENSEPALHAVLEKLAGMQAKAEISGRLADVRDRERIMALMREFKPDIVFHAAALEARAAVGNRLGRGHQDQRVRLDQRRRCRQPPPAPPPW